MLTLPPKFKQALGNGTRTSLYPLVRIYKGVEIDDPLDSATEIINLSIKETTIKNLDDTYEGYIPLLLNIPSISSKADIINNKYTISSVSLSISNGFYNGKIFSDDIPSLLNAVVQVYYAANGLDSLEDCLLVYTGTIRRYSQSGETLSLTLEDVTQQKLATKIPFTLIEDEDNFKKENIGKPYPLVYGYVDKSPLIMDRYDSLILDKPNRNISGLWNGATNLLRLNPYIQHTSLYGDWLQDNSHISIFNDGHLYISEKFPKNFGTRQYDLYNETMYNFENATPNYSAKININTQNLLYDKYEEVDGEVMGVGNIGIPTRIYRPIREALFYSLNYDEQYLYYTAEEQSSSFNDYYYKPPSANKIYGFSDTPFNTNVSKDIIPHTYNITDEGDAYDENNFIIEDNSYSEADLFYALSVSNEDYTWWQPTELNLNEVLEDGIWDSKDTTYPEDNQKFNVNWIQNANYNSGLHIHAVNLHRGGGNPPAGCYVRLQLNEDNVPDFPAVSKLFYKIDYFTPSNIAGYAQAEPSAFWSQRELLERTHNDNDSFGDMVSSKNKWDTNRGEENWVTYCEVPNVHHSFIPTASQHRYTNYDLGGIEYDNVILGFSSTKSTDSINWGFPIPKMDTNLFQDSLTASSCFANLKEIYTIQDVLATEYVTQEYYGSIKGRMNDGDLLTKPHEILKDILEREIGYDKEVVLPVDNIEDNWMYSFSMQEQKEAKNVIENLFKSSLFIPSFDSFGNFKFIDLKQNIEDYEQFEVINNLDIIKYSFGLTKIEDVKNQVNVKYKKDYGSDELEEETSYSIEDNSGNFVETLDELTQQLTSDMVYDIGYYKMKDEDARLEIETEYIRDKNTARKLQRKLLMWYANQHLTAKIDLPLSYMHLEAGDYLRFDELIGGKLAFGFDYTQEFVKNGQLIYPVFFVTKVAKSLSKVSLELVQLHRGDFGMSNNDLNNYLIPNPYGDSIYDDTTPDEFYFDGSWYLNNNDLQTGSISAVTSTNLETDIEIEVQLIDSSANISIDGFEIPESDDDGYFEGIGDYIDGTNLVNATIVKTESLFGDNIDIYPVLSENDIVFLDDNDIVDLRFKLIVRSNIYDYEYALIFNHIISQADYEIGDVNQDGIVNVLDVIGMVQYIIGETNFTDQQLLLADLNGDGGVNVLDIALLINIILGN